MTRMAALSRIATLEQQGRLKLSKPGKEWAPSTDSPRWSALWSRRCEGVEGAWKSASRGQFSFCPPNLSRICSSVGTTAHTSFALRPASEPGTCSGGWRATSCIQHHIFPFKVAGSKLERGPVFGAEAVCMPLYGRSTIPRGRGSLARATSDCVA
jgi:hypothetical protein